MGAEAPGDPAVRRLRAPLLRWYRKAARDLPWRRTSDPYAIWVSEIMLQQTTVAAVIPYWERFLARFPDVAALAGSREEDVLAAWTGLGYYRRARSLRAGAVAVMERHEGRVPSGFEDLLELPGIGRYTAGAISSVAFGRETPVVDGNVKRVLARLFGFRGEGASDERKFWAIATELVHGSTPGDLNQAVMELGATVCTPRRPRCEACPVATFCRAFARGTPEAFPVAPPRKRARVLGVAMGWIERRGRILLERHREDGPLRGTWDLPSALPRPGEAPAAALARELRARHGLRPARGTVTARVKHAILDTRLEIAVVRVPAVAVSRRVSLRWVAIDALADTATSSATIKAARAIAAQKRSQDSLDAASSSSRTGLAKA